MNFYTKGQTQTIRLFNLETIEKISTAVVTSLSKRTEKHSFSLVWPETRFDDNIRAKYWWIFCSVRWLTHSVGVNAFHTLSSRTSFQWISKLRLHLFFFSIESHLIYILICFSLFVIIIVSLIQTTKKEHLRVVMDIHNNKIK